MRTGNPTLKEGVFRSAARQLEAGSPLMTIEGTMIKTSVLLMAMLATSIFSWQQAISGQGGAGWVMAGFIGSMALGVAIAFKPSLAPVLAVPHALTEGLLLGGISAVYASRFNGEQALGGMSSGIVFQAVTLTFGVAFAMLGLYSFRLIRVTERLRSVVTIATVGIMGVYLVSFLLSLFMGSSAIGFLHGASLFGVGFSLFVVGLAAFNLLLDFDLIERGSAAGAPKYMEWYGAFALIVTLAWLYLEMLRLLSKLNQRR